jgi:hypothetical protein
LERKRPETIDEYKRTPFVLETFKATKVVFLPGFLKNAVPSLKELVVWVSEPNALTLNQKRDQWCYDGTFLYLVGSFRDDVQCGTFFSGCSALQAIANVVQGQPLVQTNWDEPFGRKSFLHPVEKLKQLGGFAMDAYDIEALYRNR